MKLSNNEFLLSLVRLHEDSKIAGNVSIEFKSCMSFPPHQFLVSDFGDAFARSRSAVKMASVKGSSQCLVRAFSGNTKISTVLDRETSDRFRKRLGSVLKGSLLRSRLKKRTASQ
jgi:hypothetical protein